MQSIRFEFADLPILGSGVLNTINQLAIETPGEDIRVTDDGNGNIKVYVGDLNEEDYRYWIYTDGRIILKEVDISPEDSTPGKWQVVVDPPVEEPAV
jgi:hypothetical protein